MNFSEKEMSTVNEYRQARSSDLQMIMGSDQIEFYLNECGRILDLVLEYINDVQFEAEDLKSYFLDACKDYVRIFGAFSDYEHDADFNEFEKMPNLKNVHNEAKKFFTSIFTNQSTSNYSSFLAIAALQRLDKTGTDNIEEKINEIKALKDKAETYSNEIGEMKDKSFAKAYSKIFQQEASYHSSFRIIKDKEKNKNNDDTDNPQKKLGVAEKFASLGVLIILGLILSIVFDIFIPNTEVLESNKETLKYLGFDNITYSELLIPFYVKKGLLLALLLFGIKFSFKQYSIHKHLHTLNKQRANSLDSFNLFYDRFEKGTAEHKDQFMIEVAKSIFSMGDTGYIKNSTNESVSIIDNIKFLKDKS